MTIKQDIFIPFYFSIINLPCWEICFSPCQLVLSLTAQSILLRSCRAGLCTKPRFSCLWEFNQYLCTFFCQKRLPSGISGRENDLLELTSIVIVHTLAINWMTVENISCSVSTNVAGPSGDSTHNLITSWIHIRLTHRGQLQSMVCTWKCFRYILVYMSICRQTWKVQTLIRCHKIWHLIRIYNLPLIQQF